MVQRDVCASLQSRQLTGRLRELGLPTAVRDLRRLALSVREAVSQIERPPVYREFCSRTRGDRLSLQFVEFCIPVTPFHMDFDGITSSQQKRPIEKSWTALLKKFLTKIARTAAATTSLWAFAGHGTCTSQNRMCTGARIISNRDISGWN